MFTTLFKLKLKRSLYSFFESVHFDCRVLRSTISAQETNNDDAHTVDGIGTLGVLFYKRILVKPAC